MADRGLLYSVPRPQNKHHRCFASSDIIFILDLLPLCLRAARRSLALVVSYSCVIVIDIFGGGGGTAAKCSDQMSRRGQLENMCAVKWFLIRAVRWNVKYFINTWYSYTLLTSRLSNKLRLIHIRSQMAFENAFYNVHAAEWKLTEQVA